MGRENNKSLSGWRQALHGLLKYVEGISTELLIELYLRRGSSLFTYHFSSLSSGLKTLSASSFNVAILLLIIVYSFWRSTFSRSFRAILSVSASCSMVFPLVLLVFRPPSTHRVVLQAGIFSPSHLFLLDLQAFSLGPVP